jgi:hypothetical protein
MRCVILQPSFVPWRGYFHQIRLADVFVFYDDVPYDARGWRNRNRVKAPGGSRWLTIPVLRSGARERGATIREIRISRDRDWSRTHRTTLEHLYAKAPHFADYRPLLDRIYGTAPELLADFTIDVTVAVAAELGIRDTRFVRSSTLARPAARKTDDLLSILRMLGATRYLTGPAARAYLDEPALARAGIALEYMRYDYPEYPQLYPPFDPQVSILDLLFMTGRDAARYIWDIAPGRREP